MLDFFFIANFKSSYILVIDATPTLLIQFCNGKLLFRLVTSSLFHVLKTITGEIVIGIITKKQNMH